MKALLNVSIFMFEETFNRLDQNPGPPSNSLIILNVQLSLNFNDN